MTDKELSTGFERYLLTERRVARNTFSAYVSDLAQYRDYLSQLNKSLQTSDEKTIKAFLKHLKDTGLGARSLARKISCLKAFYGYAHEHHGLANSSKQLFTPRHEKKLPHYLHEDDIELLLQTSHQEKTAVGERNRIMLYVLYSSGMRISELIQMKVEEVNFLEGALTITGKGGKQRIIPLPEAVMHLLKQYLETTHPRLTTKKGTSHTCSILFPTFYNGALRAVTRQSFWLYLTDLAHKAGLSHPLSPHQLRHSLATHLLKRGVHLRSLQMLLGHENLQTVQVYTHVETDHLRKIYDKKHPRS